MLTYQESGKQPTIPQLCSHWLPLKWPAPALCDPVPCPGPSPGECPSHPPESPRSWSASGARLEAGRQPVGPDRGFSQGASFEDWRGNLNKKKAGKRIRHTQLPLLIELGSKNPKIIKAVRRKQGLRLCSFWMELENHIRPKTKGAAYEQRWWQPLFNIAAYPWGQTGLCTEKKSLMILHGIRFG